MLDTVKGIHLASYGREALAVLGPREYARLVLTLMRYAPLALRDRAQAQKRIGRSMGRRQEPLIIHFKGHAIKWDAAFMDRISLDIPSFMLVQEMAIRGSYFKNHPAALPHFASAVDLGGNLGTFSLLIAPLADKVVTVETDPALCAVIRHNLEINHFNHVCLENAYMGGSGMSARTAPSISMEDLIKKHNLSQIGFIKIDIEGSEFELFEAPSWLAITSYLSMEVHLNRGDLRLITDRLARHGFQWCIADGMHFHLLPNDCDTSGLPDLILYARKMKPESPQP